MRLGLVLSNGLVLAAIGWMATAFGMEQQAVGLLAHKNLQGIAPANIQQLESQAALTPGAGPVAALANAYLDREQPGLATAVLEMATREVRDRPEVAQIYARALFHRGHAREALVIARAAHESCLAAVACAPWVVAKTTGQVAFFEEVVAAGIEDPQSDPNATWAAYERSSHEVRLIAMR